MKLSVYFIGFIFGLFPTDGTAIDIAHPVNNVSTTVCVFDCIEAFQRKGVQGGPMQIYSDVTSLGCGEVDMTELDSMCKSFRMADSCLRACVNDETKQLLMEGFNYLCIDRYAELEKYTPCYKEQCQSIAFECGFGCGATADSVFNHQDVSVNQMTTSEPFVRRRRQAVKKETVEATSTEDNLQIELQETVRQDLLKTREFVNCFVNCSKPTVQDRCGDDAYDLMKESAGILFSFLVRAVTPYNVSDILYDGKNDVIGTGIPSSMAYGSSTSQTTVSIFAMFLMFFSAIISLI